MARTNDDVLMSIARETADDNGVDLATAIWMLDDEPGEVARMAAAVGVAITREEIGAWVRERSQAAEAVQSVQS